MRFSACSGAMSMSITTTSPPDRRSRLTLLQAPQHTHPLSARPRVWGGMLAEYWNSVTAARMTRRRALAVGGASAMTAAALAVVGCGPGSEPPVRPTPSAPGGADILNPGGIPRPGGRFRTANAANFGTFDPHLGVQVASAYFPRIYNVLVNQSATRPEWMYFDLAEKLETPDANTYIFQIRPGVKTAPNDLGVPERDLDGEDVKVTLERLKAEPRSNQFAFARDNIESITVDGRFVTIKTPRPYAWFLNRIGLFFNAIAPRELLTGNVDRLADKAAGAGPFRLTSVTEGESASFDRNPNYYRTDEANGGARLPYVDGLDARTVFDRSSQRVAFEAGQIHMLMTGSGAEARSLSDVIIARDPAFNYISLTMNARRGQFADPRVRRAISRAINRKQFAEIVYGGDAQPDGLVQWSLGSYALPANDLESTYQPFNVEQARALVQEAGGIRIKVMFPANVPILEHSAHLPIFLEQMKAAGIEVEQDPQDFGTWVSNYQSLNYDSSLALNQTYETPELPLKFHTTRGPFGDDSYIKGLGDAEIDAAVDRVSQEMELDARVKLTHDAQKLIYDKDPMMLPLVTPYNHLVYRKSVKNITAGIGTSSYLVSSFWLDT